MEEIKGLLSRIFGGPPVIPANDTIKNVSTNQVVGTGVQALNPVQSDAVNKAMTAARLAQAANPTALEEASMNFTSGAKNIANRAIRNFNNVAPINLDSISLFPEVSASTTTTPPTSENVVDVLTGADTGVQETSAVRRYIENFGTRPSTNIEPTENFLDTAESTFRSLFGDDPNFEQMLTDYEETVRGIAQENQISIQQAQELVDEQFKAAEQEISDEYRRSRQTLADQAFVSGRGQQQALAERGLGGSGAAQLGLIQQRIAQGDATSDLYRQFTQSVQQVAQSKAESNLQFSNAITELNNAVSRDLTNFAQKISSDRQTFNLQRGQIIQSLAEAARTNNIQQSQQLIEQWESGLEFATLLDQEAKDGAQSEIDLVREGTAAIIAQITADPNLDDEEKGIKIAEAQANQALKINEITSAIGLTTSDIISGLLETAPTTTTRPSFPGLTGSIAGMDEQSLRNILFPGPIGRFG